MSDYAHYFQMLTGLSPHSWQAALGESPAAGNRLIRIPTGFGKTVGTAAAWLFNRVERSDSSWPNRLVWCLPMRTLVEQTADQLRSLAQPFGVPVHLVMGGVDSEEWDLVPDKPAILVGTQDMLMSAALNRGYGAPRARWPLQFGLLNHDALWVMDEVQLMDIGLATSAQLQAIREEYACKALRPCFTWWMSATLQPAWLRSVDTAPMVDALADQMLSIPQTQQQSGFWEIAKPLQVQQAEGAKAIAELVMTTHDAVSDSPDANPFGRITLVILNTVKLANEVHKILAKNYAKSDVELRLVHSRFRGAERAAWRSQFLSRAHCCPGAHRIIVATQVVEAGVDISATTLITELAPWPSLVQRFGRAARYGGTARVVVVDQGFTDDKKAAPYSADQIEASRTALAMLEDAGIRSLQALEAGLAPELLQSLYPYQPLHLLLQRELLELLDTTPDLSGADVDISRFIRSGDDRDLRVFWRDMPKDEAPSEEITPVRDELCAIPIGEGAKWVMEAAGQKRAWVWDYLDGSWVASTPDRLFPGQTVLIQARHGGYSISRGWTGKADDKVLGVPTATLAPVPDYRSDSSQQADPLSVQEWKTIAQHGAEAAAEWLCLGQTVALPDHLVAAGEVAARWHDAGKAHPAFVSCLRPDASQHPGRQDLAKAPDAAWKPLNDKTRYSLSPQDRRPGFRHELASALAMFSALRQVAPRHPALQSELSHIWAAPDTDRATSLRDQQQVPCAESPGPLDAAQELAGLTSCEFNLAAYLVSSHHGKLRLTWSATPMDQKATRGQEGRLPIAGIRQGDPLPQMELASLSGPPGTLSPQTLTLELAGMGLTPQWGVSWTSRCQQLTQQYGPFALCFLEALFRVADIRASKGASGLSAGLPTTFTPPTEV